MGVCCLEEILWSIAIISDDATIAQSNLEATFPALGTSFGLSAEAAHFLPWREG